MKQFSLIGSLVFGALLSVAAGAAEEAAPAGSGMSLADKVTACTACHGENGAKPILPEYPILAGQHADYLAAALRAYRDGRRQNPIMGMQLQALQLSDADINMLAKHFSIQHGVATLQK